MRLGPGPFSLYGRRGRRIPSIHRRGRQSTATAVVVELLGRLRRTEEPELRVTRLRLARLAPQRIRPRLRLARLALKRIERGGGLARLGLWLNVLRCPPDGAPVAPCVQAGVVPHAVVISRSHIAALGLAALAGRRPKGSGGGGIRSGPPSAHAAPRHRRAGRLAAPSLAALAQR